MEETMPPIKKKIKVEDELFDGCENSELETSSQQVKYEEYIELLDEAIHLEYENGELTLEGGPESISDENFSRKRKLFNDNKHPELKHSSRARKDSNPFQKLESFKCNKCDSLFSRRAKLNRHIISVHEKSQGFKCPNCDYSCSKKGNLARHIKTVHNIPIKCPLCDFALSDRSSLNSHIESVHEKLRPFNLNSYPRESLIISSQETDNDSSQETENDSTQETENDSSQETENDSDILVEKTNISSQNSIFEVFDDYDLDVLDELTSNDSISSDDDDGESQEEEFNSDDTNKRPSFIWNKVKKAEFKAKPLEFTGLQKVKIECNNTESPLEIFKCLLNDSIINFIINETNLYGDKLIKCCQARNTENKYIRPSKWQKLTKDEFYKYIGIVMYMSLKPFIKIKDYWAKNMWGDSEVRKHITRDRFFFIDKCLHFWNAGNINDAQGQVKLKKINHLLNLFKTSFANSYYPTANLILDESIIGWKGQLHFKTCIKSKHTRSGIKLCELRDSSNGYHLNFLICSGDDIPLESRFGNEMPCATKTEKIVCALVEPYIKAGHTLYVDSYYNSPLLCAYLRGKGLMDVVGIICSKGKECPSNLAKLVVAPDKSIDFEGQCLGSLVLLQKWAPKNGKYVQLITTKHNNDMVVKKPVSILDYNKTIGEVDTVDQKILQPFKLKRYRPNGMKWTMKLFKRLLNIVVHNSFIIHCYLNPEEFTITNNNFRRKLVEEIFLESCAKQVHGNSDQFEGVNHVMTSNKKSRHCWYCPRYRGIKNKKTVWICPSCNGIQLCKDPCFIEFHHKLWAGELQL